MVYPIFIRITEMTNVQFFEAVVKFAAERPGGFFMSEFFLDIGKPTDAQHQIIYTLTNDMSSDMLSYKRNEKQTSVEEELCQSEDTESQHSRSLCNCVIYNISAHGLEVYNQIIVLEESRKSSEDAQRKSKQAIWIAIAAMFISSFIGIFQIITPVEIKFDQFNEIINSLSHIDNKAEYTSILDDYQRYLKTKNQ
jgi:hypothetical protein